MPLGLRHPIFGNSYSQDHQVVLSTLMSGELRVFRDSSWPSLITQKMEIRALTNDKKEAFLNFVNAVAGTEIPMTDHEGVLWTGIFVTDPVAVCEGEKCLWRITFDFLGKRV